MQIVPRMDWISNPAPRHIQRIGALVAALAGCGAETPREEVLASVARGAIAPAAADAPAGPGCLSPPASTGDACEDPLAPGTSRACTFLYGGQARSFLVYAPKTYDPCVPTPVVVDAHGKWETAEQQAGLDTFGSFPGGLGSGFRLVADQENLIVVNPQGIDNDWGPSDADFILEVERKVTTIANVDPARVFMSGLSMGGLLTYWTACRDSGVFRAFAPISGAADTPACPLTRAAPVIGFHARWDWLIPFSSGRRSASTWADKNRCAAGPTVTTRFGGPGGDARPLCLDGGTSGAPWRLVPCAATASVSSCETWSDCDDGADVTFCTVNGARQRFGGHVLYFNDTRLSVAAVAWEFFKQHSPQGL